MGIIYIKCFFFLSLPFSWWGRFVKDWLVQLTQTNVWWSLSRGRTLVMFLLLASSALLLSYSVIVMINKMKLILHVNPWLNNQKKRILVSCDRWIYFIHFFLLHYTNMRLDKHLKNLHIKTEHISVTDWKTRQ